MKPTTDRKTLGAWGERIAREYLETKGYRFVAANFHCIYGEIDLICRKDNLWCFIEVKTRRTSAFGTGYQSITRLKQQHIIQAAALYLDQTRLYDVPVRFDVVSIDFISATKYQVTLIENAFTIQ